MAVNTRKGNYIMSLTSKIEELKEKALKKADQELKRLNENIGFLKELEKQYPSIAERTEHLPYFTTRSSIWIDIEAESMHDALTIVENIEHPPCMLTSRSNGCLEILEDVKDTEYNLDSDKDIGFLLIHHEQDIQDHITKPTLEIRLPLEMNEEIKIIHLKIKVKKPSPSQIKPIYEGEGNRRILKGFQLGYTYNGTRIKWASGDHKTPNKFTEYFEGCSNLDEIKTSYPLFEN